MRLSVILLLLFACHCASAQKNYYFSKLTVEDGLNDSHIQAIGEDRFGYMWFGSLGGLNRYDGRTIKTFAHTPGDSTSILSGLAMSIVTDSTGHLLVSFTKGMMEFDFNTAVFHNIKAASNLFIWKILPVSRELVLLATDTGLLKYNPQTKQISRFEQPGDHLLHQAINDIYRTGNKLYIATPTGVVFYDLTTQQSVKADLPVPGLTDVLTITADQPGNIWLTTTGKIKIIRISPDLKSYETYDQYLAPDVLNISTNCRLLKDKNNRIWISAKSTGLLEYNPANNTFSCYAHDEQKHWTISTNANIYIYGDKEGNIWLGGNRGINMFNPEKTLFQTIIPFKTDLDLRDRRFGRSVTEDRDHHLWFGTLDGLVQYNRTTGATKEWRNEPGRPPVLGRNHIRHLYCDAHNNIWISTTKGLNFYDRQTGKISLFSPPGAPPDLYHMFTFEDQEHVLWFLNNGGDGIYFYDPNTRNLQSIKNHPYMKRFAGMMAWCMLQDQKGRFWIGFEKNGVGMYDPATHKTELWNSTSEEWPVLAGDLVFDLKEDKNGVIWAATSSGLTGIDVDHHRHWLFNNSNGLGSNTAMPIAVDQQNRLWIGTGRGLMMLDSSRSHFTAFGINDGLPSTHFTESQGTVTSQGEIIMATQNGYILFDPSKYQTTSKPVHFYVPSYQVFNQENLLPESDLQPTSIALKPNENFFTLNMRSINFMNPEQTWYAYKLEGFDPDWRYTQDPGAVYTSVPGGTYLFKFKATLDPNDWTVQEKTIRIEIGTIFYKTWWFLLLNIMTIGLVSYYIINQRIRNAKNLHALTTKAQLLEKEKTAVMYENLKQHLNPHFLFNSLASLSSLIRLNPKMAIDFLDKMSKVYRYILKNKDNETVPLVDELNFVDMYIQLQKTRFEEGIQVNIDIPEVFYHRKIVPVTLQNLVENAIKHNITDPEEPLIIHIFSEQDYLIVRNNLQLKTFVETSNRQGLSSMISLYSFLSDRPVLIEQTTDSYTIKIPLL